MIYEKYLESISADGFSVTQELARAKRLFRTLYAPEIPGGAASRILDIGCGFGKILWAAREQGFSNIEGVDISEDQVAFGRSVLKLPIEKCDASAKLATYDGDLDVVLAIDVLEHCELEYSVDLLRGARNALRSGGVLIVQVPNGLAPFAPTFHGDVTHVRAYSAQSLAQLFRLGGFKSFRFRATPPIVHGASSAARSLFWRLVFNPLVTGYFLAAYGDTLGGIYTPNILGIAINTAR